MKAAVSQPIRLSKPEDCVACPVEVRGMFAAAANTVLAFDGWQAGTDDLCSVAKNVAELKRTVEKFQPVIDAHFADRAHSHRP